MGRGHGYTGAVFFAHDHPLRVAREGRQPRFRLLADPECLDRRAVTLDVLLAEVVEEPPPLSDQLQQAATRVMVVLVHFEVLGEFFDPPREQRDLDLGRSGVILVSAERPNGLSLYCPGNQKKLSERQYGGRRTRSPPRLAGEGRIAVPGGQASGP